jgi:hypothetical protein
MSDLFLGQTCTESYKFISAGTAHTFTFNFQPDKVVFNNITKWVATAGNLPISIWWRDQTGTGDAQQQVVVDTSAGASFNFKTEATDGFTVADTSGGQATSHATISGISAADPCVVTHSAYTFQTNQIVRFTDLGEIGPGVASHGMGPLNNNRYRIVVLSPTTVSLKDVITGEPIDSLAFPAYVSGGRMTLETHVISLNNPQVTPYSNASPYDPNPYQYDPVTYRLTAGSAVMGADGDLFRIEVYKFGQVIDLGDLLT